MSGEGRPIHDMRRANEDSPKELHPPALQPRHKQLARLSAWWGVRHPRVRQVCAKRDVSRAFKWHEVRNEDVEEFGTSLPGQVAGLGSQRVIIIHCVMVFGWAGAPGEYMILAWGAKGLHESYRPGSPHINDTVHFSSRWLMDDAVVLEPCVGLRPWLSGDVLEDAMTKTWGPGAVNASKREKEGEFKAE